jgi:hypothetical protein
MREVEVGIHIRVEKGIGFVGIEEVNQLVQAGYRVAKIEAGGAIMDKLGEEGGYVQLTLTGCTIKILLEEGLSESVPIRDDDPEFIDRLLENNAAFRRLCEERKREVDEGRVVPLADVRRC